jgi:adenylosuccinate lyase
MSEKLYAALTDIQALEAVGPLDGRYADKTQPLREFFSESALIRYRRYIEVEYLLALSEHPKVPLRSFTKAEQQFLGSFQQDNRDLDHIIKRIETKGYKGSQPTNHDVKAVEYGIGFELADTSLADIEPWIHFALTSEDTTNLAIALMLQGALDTVILPKLDQTLEVLATLASRYAEDPMLARTQLRAYRVLVKLNGAVGNYNAHVASLPQVDWIQFTVDFVGRLNVGRDRFEANLFTTQVEPHDTYAELFNTMSRINVILRKFAKDMWGYISNGWIVQLPKKGEVGSSTMPHKVNPIDFENAEGNLGVANALLEFFARDLPDFRWQRDLSDSTVERNFGVAFGYGLIAYSAILKGLGKIDVNRTEILRVLVVHQELLAEPIQMILRRVGVPHAYEQLKKLTRGKEGVTLADIHSFIDGLDHPNVTGEVKEELKQLTVETYLGYAVHLTDLALGS